MEDGAADEAMAFDPQHVERFAKMGPLESKRYLPVADILRHLREKPAAALTPGDVQLILKAELLLNGAGAAIATVHEYKDRLGPAYERELIKIYIRFNMPEAEAATEEFFRKHHGSNAALHFRVTTLVRSGRLAEARHLVLDFAAAHWALNPALMQWFRRFRLTEHMVRYGNDFAAKLLPHEAKLIAAVAEHRPIGSAIYINLDRDFGRRRAMDFFWSERFCSLERLAAVNAQALPGKIVESRFSAKPPLGRGAVGCALSHWRALELALDSDADVTIVMEDDAIPLFPLSGEVLAAAKEHDIVFANDRNYRRWKDTRPGAPALVAPDKADMSGGADCYIVSKAGASKLLRRLENHPINRHIDGVYTTMALSQSIRGAILTAPLAEHYDFGHSTRFEEETLGTRG